MKSSVAVNIVSLTLALASPIQKRYTPHQDLSSSLQNILDNTHNSPAYEYPTDLTQGIIPKPIHSHNDYWRKIPFYTALSNGAISIEADVWFYNDTLYVGHDRLSLTAARTFDSLYVQPILNTLNAQNPRGEIVSEQTKYGVYDTNPAQTLYLFVDLKTDGATTFPAVINALQPLREAGYLSNYTGTETVPGAVTVIGTGNTPLNQVAGVAPRDYFFDANLSQLNTTQVNITSDVSPIASTQFSATIGTLNGTDFSQEQLQKLQDEIEFAKSKGIGARYWDTPAFPISTRNAVWRTLIAQGVALLNADDLAAAAGYATAAPW